MSYTTVLSPLWRKNECVLNEKLGSWCNVATEHNDLIAVSLKYMSHLQRTTVQIHSL